MISSTSFFMWFFEGMRGVGGWLIFLILALIALMYVLMDSSNRSMPAKGWKLAVILTSLLIIPVVVYHFLPAEPQLNKMYPYKEYIFYIGLIGGIIPCFLALGYWLQFRGMVICEKGHLYSKTLKECPECIPTNFVEYDPSELDETQLDIGETSDTVVEDTLGVTKEDQTEIAEREFFETQVGKIGLPDKAKVKSGAFLLFPQGQSCQLNQGATTIGRGSSNDCMIQNTFVSRNHAKIVEEGRSLFRLYDLGSSNGTWLNGRKLMKATLLENDDQIRFGDEVTVVFLSSRNI
ncbi:MAG: FHA domain-containing protein [Anaerolineaceae bacterium]